MTKLLAFGLIVLLAACSSGSADHDNVDRATKLAHQYIITDGHVDLPYRLKVSNFRLEREYLGIPIQTDKGDFDFVRAKEGGLDAPFMSIFIPADKSLDVARLLADTLIDMVEGIADAHPDKFAVVATPDEVEANFERGIISLPMGMENGSPLGNDLANVGYFRGRGISYITLTHSKDNQICDSSYDTTRTWGGLSPFGVEVVKEMNRTGIMVDVSHISDDAFWQVMDLTEVPVIASHSSCRYYTPDFERNMDDEMIQRLAQNGGVIQINFGSSFIDSASRAYYAEARKVSGAWMKENNVKRGSPEYKDFMSKYTEEHGSGFSDVVVVADHIEHVVKIAGIDHVGLGSDFDGVGDSLPVGLKDVSDYPNLIRELLDRGFSDEDIEKICYGNVARVWRAVLSHAEAQGS